jgi:aspartate aminotransferase
MERPAKRLSLFSESQTLAMARKSRELKAQGVDVVSLSLGEPDLDTPLNVKEAAKQAIDDNWSHYPPVAGYPELREACARKFLEQNGLHYTPDQIIVSTGAKQSIANVVLSLIDPGDEVIIPAPYWVSYLEMVRLAEGVPVVIRAGIETDFKISARALEAAITPRTKLIMYSSPSNPTGSCYTRAELEAFAEVLRRHPHVMVMSDEIYEHILFKGEHVSIASLPDMAERVITVNGVSKGYAMTGWRIGYIGAPLWVAKACDKMQGQFTSGANSIAQRASIVAVSTPKADLMPMVDIFLKRRDLVVALFSDIPGMRVNVPDGAFYLFPDVSALLGHTYRGHVVNTSYDLCMYLLEVGHVAMVSGDAFGAPECVRISYATSEDQLREAARRIKEALA